MAATLWTVSLSRDFLVVDVDTSSRAEAQMRTEDAVTKLASTVGRLSDTIGHDLESIARAAVPDWLEAHLGVKVPSVERRVFTIDGEEAEVDFYGEGISRRARVVILGEAKSYPTAKSYGTHVFIPTITSHTFATRTG